LSGPDIPRLLIRTAVNQEPKKTVKYLLGLAAGCKVVTTAWLSSASTAAAAAHVVHEGRGGQGSCLAGFRILLASDEQAREGKTWAETFRKVLRRAGAHVGLMSAWEPNQEWDIVVANPYQENPWLCLPTKEGLKPTRTAKALLKQGAQLATGDWLICALRGNDLPPFPDLPLVLRDLKDAATPLRTKPRVSPRSPMKPIVATKPQAMGRGGHSGGDGLRWVGPAVEAPKELKGQSRTFYAAFSFVASPGRLREQVKVGECVQVETAKGEVQVVRVVAVWEEATRRGRDCLMRATRFYNPKVEYPPSSWCLLLIPSEYRKVLLFLRVILSHISNYL
jgi:hypothetical protein